MGAGAERPGWARRLARREGRRVLVLAALWWVLTGGDAGAWTIGLPVVGAAALVGAALRPAREWRWRLGGVVRFVPFFVWHSLRGGADVARRAFDPRLPLEPTVHDHPWRLPEGAARVFLANLVGLLPGTLAVQVTPDVLQVHALTAGRLEGDLKAAENAVAALFGVGLAGDGPVTA